MAELDSPSGKQYSEQDILNSLFDEVRRTLRADAPVVTLVASAAFNAAGSAQVLAASAGVAYNIPTIILAMGAASASVALKSGSTRIIPWAIHTSKAKFNPNLGRAFGGAVNTAIKVSASVGSGVVHIHYYKTRTQ